MLRSTETSLISEVTSSLHVGGHQVADVIKRAGESRLRDGQHKASFYPH